MVYSFLQLKLAQSLSKKLKSVIYRREYRTLRVRPTCCEWGFYNEFQFGREIFSQLNNPATVLHFQDHLEKSMRLNVVLYFWKKSGAWRTFRQRVTCEFKSILQ